MKKIYCTIGMLLLFLIPITHAAELPGFPFVFAEGKATIEVPPDITEVSFYVLQFDENEINALQVVRDRSAELIKFFSSLKIDEKDIISYEINKKAIREHKDYEELKILGYEISREFTVKLRDLNQYEVFAKKLLSLKNVVNNNTDFDRTDRKNIEKELFSKSCQHAKENAELMANGFGSKLGEVYAISEQGFGSISEKFTAKFYISGPLSMNPDLLFIPSTITLGKNVSVIFRLEGK